MKFQHALLIFSISIDYWISIILIWCWSRFQLTAWANNNSKLFSHSVPESRPDVSCLFNSTSNPHCPRFHHISKLSTLWTEEEMVRSAVPSCLVFFLKVSILRPDVFLSRGTPFGWILPTVWHMKLAGGPYDTLAIRPGHKHTPAQE